MRNHIVSKWRHGKLKQLKAWDFCEALTIFKSTVSMCVSWWKKQKTHPMAQLSVGPSYTFSWVTNDRVTGPWPSSLIIISLASGFTSLLLSPQLQWNRGWYDVSIKLSSVSITTALNMKFVSVQGTFCDLFLISLFLTSCLSHWHSSYLKCSVPLKLLSFEAFKELIHYITKPNAVRELLLIKWRFAKKEFFAVTVMSNSSYFFRLYILADYYNQFQNVHHAQMYVYMHIHQFTSA